MKIINGKMRMFCVSNIIASFVCTSFLGTTYCADSMEVGQSNNQESLATSEVEPLSQMGEELDAAILDAVNEIKEKEAAKVNTKTKVTTKKKTTSVVTKKVVNATTKYEPAKYNEVTGSAIVEYAKKYLGLRYSSGLSLSTGTDCSGFTKLSYKEFGTTLGRTTGSQSKSGTYVRKSDLQKGDLVFYSNGSGKITHVTIYIGGGQVIHESNHRDGVKISSVNMMQYITARRVINAKANQIAEEKQKAVEASTTSNNNTSENTEATVETPIVKDEVSTSSEVVTNSEQTSVTNEASQEVAPVQEEKPVVNEVIENQETETVATAE